MVSRQHSSKVSSSSSSHYRWHTHPKYLPYPAKHVSIRGIEEDKYTVIDVTRVGQAGGEPKVLEEIEDWRAIFEVCAMLTLCASL